MNDDQLCILETKVDPKLAVMSSLTKNLISKILENISCS